MIYKMIVNAAFLAIGYYIGKEVGRTEQVRKATAQPRQSGTGVSGKPPAADAANKSGS